MRGGGVGQKSYLGPTEIASFPSRSFSQSNKHNTFWHAVSTGYVLLLWNIAVSDFRPLEIYKNLGLPLPAITFTNSQVDSQFYKYI